MDDGTCVMNNAWRGLGGVLLSITKKMQLYTISFIYYQWSACFRLFLRPSSGAQNLYTQHLV